MARKKQQIQLDINEFEDLCRQQADILIQLGRYEPPGYKVHRIVAVEVYYIHDQTGERKSHRFYLPDEGFKAEGSPDSTQGEG